MPTNLGDATDEPGLLLPLSHDATIDVVPVESVGDDFRVSFDQVGDGENAYFFQSARRARPDSWSTLDGTRQAQIES